MQQGIRLLAIVVAKNAVGSSWRKTLGTREKESCVLMLVPAIAMCMADVPVRQVSGPESLRRRRRVCAARPCACCSPKGRSELPYRSSCSSLISPGESDDSGRHACGSSTGKVAWTAWACTL